MYIFKQTYFLVVLVFFARNLYGGFVDLYFLNYPLVFIIADRKQNAKMIRNKYIHSYRILEDLPRAIKPRNLEINQTSTSDVLLLILPTF